MKYLAKLLQFEHNLLMFIWLTTRRLNNLVRLEELA